MADPYRRAGHASDTWRLVGSTQAVKAPWLTLAAFVGILVLPVVLMLYRQTTVRCWHAEEGPTSCDVSRWTVFKRQSAHVEKTELAVRDVDYEDTDHVLATTSGELSGHYPLDDSESARILEATARLRSTQLASSFELRMSNGWFTFLMGLLSVVISVGPGWMLTDSSRLWVSNDGRTLRYHAGVAGFQRKREVARERIKKVEVDTFDEAAKLRLQIDDQWVGITKGKEAELRGLADAIRSALKMDER